MVRIDSGGSNMLNMVRVGLCLDFPLLLGSSSHSSDHMRLEGMRRGGAVWRKNIASTQKPLKTYVAAALRKSSSGDR